MVEQKQQYDEALPGRKGEGFFFVHDNNVKIYKRLKGYLYDVR
jgi:hypothetical protein